MLKSSAGNANLYEILFTDLCTGTLFAKSDFVLRNLEQLQSIELATSYCAEFSRRTSQTLENLRIL